MSELLNSISEVVNAALGVDFGTILIQLVGVLILFIVVKVKLWGPITENIEKRRNYIEEQVSLADKAKEDALKEKEAYLETIKEAKNESREIIDNARNIANIEANRIIEEAKVKASDEISKASELIEVETQKARRELQAETIEIAFDIASKIVNKEVKSANNKEIIDDFIKGVGNSAS